MKPAESPVEAPISSACLFFRRAYSLASTDASIMRKAIFIVQERRKESLNRSPPMKQYYNMDCAVEVGFVELTYRGMVNHTSLVPPVTIEHDLG